MDSEVKMRFAHLDDAIDLFNWRNHPSTRASSLNSSEISWDTHLQWLTASLKNEKRKIFIFELGRTKIGTGRIDKLSDIHELSWALSPEYRGKGYGKVLVQMLFDTAPSPKQAKIKRENAASIKVAQMAGFKKIRSDGEIIVLTDL